jgi:hypothetical protein
MSEQGNKTVLDFAKLIAAAAIATVWLPAYPLQDKRDDKQPLEQPAQVDKGQQ